MEWKKQLNEAYALYGRAKEILGNPEATAEEKSQLETILADADALKAKALQMKDIVEKAQQIAQLAATDSEDEEERERDRAAEQKRRNAPEFKDWGEFLEATWIAAVHQTVDPRLVFYKDETKEGHSSKALSGAVGASGGFLIPTQFIPQLQAIQAEDTILRRAGATVIRMSSRQAQLPVLDQTATTAGYPHWYGGMRFYWEEEGAEKDDSEASFRMVNLVAKKLIGLTHASDELVEDSAISLADFLTGPMGFAGGVSWMEDYSFIRGVGGAQPLGVINSPCRIVVPRQTNGAFNYPDAVNMLQQFLPSGRGVWLATQSALADMIQMSGPAGNPSYVWQPNAREGVPGYLFGMPVYRSEKLPVLGTLGDVTLVDPRFYIIGDRQRTTIESTKFARWIYDQTSWRVVHRVDGQPWLNAPITYEDGTTQVSPIVVLGSTAGT